MNNPFSLENKSIIVTGASSGIGKAIAIECSKMGAQMIITGRNTSRLAATFAALENRGHEQLNADLTNEQEMSDLVTKLKGVDGIVHCAGIVDPVPYHFINKEKIEKIFNINFFIPALLTQALVKKKIIRKNSSIVFISSISGVYCSSVGGSTYSATKGAINGLIKGMAIDLASKNIRVNSICPAMIETEIFGDGRISQEQLDEDKKKYPLKRYGKPEEVAYAAIYLLSDASKWVTGSNLLIDGGFTLL